MKRQAVQAAIRELDYVPNRAARQLKGASSSVMAVIIAESGNPFCGALTLGARRAAAELKLSIATQITNDPPAIGPTRCSRRTTYWRSGCSRNWS